MFKFFKWFLVSVALVSLTACGGGGSAEDSTANGGGQNPSSQVTNTAPVAKKVKLETNPEVTIMGTFDVSDKEDSYFKYYIVEQPIFGTVGMDENNKVFTYTPKPGFVGKDTFTYKAYDGKDYSEVKEISIDVKAITINASDNVAPSRATILSINSPSSNKITLFWLGSTDDKSSQHELLYEVHCSTSKDFLSDDSTKKYAVKGALEADILGLEEDTLYYVKVKTIDAGKNEAVSSEMNITTSSANTVVLNTVNNVKKADDLFLHDAVATDTSITYSKTDKTVLPTVGDILVGDAESRTLKRVVNVNTTNTKIELVTESATMSEVFDELQMETKTMLYDPSQITTSSSNKIAYKKFTSYSYNKMPTKGYTWDSNRFKIEQPIASIAPASTIGTNIYYKQINKIGSYVKISSPSDEEIRVVSGESLVLGLLAELNEGSDSSFDADDKSRQMESFSLVSVTHDGETDANNFGFSMSSQMKHIGSKEGTIRFVATDKRASTKPYILTVRAKAKWYDETFIGTWEESEEDVEIKVAVLTKDLESSEGFRLTLEDDGEKTKYSFPIFPDFTIPNKTVHSYNVKATAGVDIDFTPTLVTKVDIDKKYVKVLLGGNMTFTLDSSFKISGGLTKSYDFDLKALNKKFINLYAAGPVPVYQEIDVTWQMQITPSTSGSIEVSNRMVKKFNVNFGVECRGTECKNLSSEDESATYTATVKVGAEASLEVRLVPKVTVSFYKAASATLAVEPWVRGGVSAEGEATFVSNYDNYDAWLSYNLKDLTATAGLDGYINADFTVMGWGFLKYPSDKEREKLFGIELDIFSLPSLGINQVSNASLASSIDLEAQINNGIRTNINTSSIEWRIHPSYGASIIKDESDTKKARLTVSEFGMYEVYFLANTDQLSGAFGQQRASITIDMRDDDGDQMADRWEEAQGLNPLDASDANEDDDSDGYSNLLEYQQGTKPNDSADYPSVPQDAIDSDAPLFTSPSTVNVNENQTSAITLVATDASSVVYRLSGTNADSFNIDESTGVVTFKNAPDYESGKISYTFTATATDEAGNSTDQTVTINILDVDETVPDTTPPVITLLGVNPTTINVGQTYTDAGAAGVDDVDGAVSVSNTGLVDVSTAGTYIITYTATDKAGNSTTANRTVTVLDIANTPPTANAGADQNLQEGEVVILDGSGSSDSDGSIVSYEWKDSSNNVFGTTAEATVPQRLTAGSYVYTLTVTDDKGATASDTVQVVVNSLPTITLSTVADINVGEIAYFNATLSKTLDASYVVKISLGDGGYLDPVEMTATAILNQYTYSKTINAAGDRVYRVALFNAFSGAQESVWTNGTYKVVDIANTPPTAVATATPTTTTEGEVISFDASGSTDSDGSITSYEWKEGSAVLSVAGSFTKSDFAVGTHTITLTVTDNENATNSVDVTINIQSNAAITTQLKKTGQTASYYVGDDGHYQAGVTPSYSRANEVVTDHITGLQWQDDVEAKTITKNWADAQTYCSSLGLDGGGWRLPSRKELVGLSYYGLRDLAIAIAIDSTFINVAPEKYWSSIAYAGTEDFSWYVDFKRSNGSQSTYYKSLSYYVRCVRGGGE